MQPFQSQFRVRPHPSFRVKHSLKDMLTRQPESTTVQYEPDSISKERLRAPIAPARVPSTDWTDDA